MGWKWGDKTTGVVWGDRTEFAARLEATADDPAFEAEFPGAAAAFRGLAETLRAEHGKSDDKPVGDVKPLGYMQ